MIILIAEAKTMDDRELPVSHVEFAANCPVGDAVANRIMERVTGLSAAELASIVKISLPMAANLLKMAYEFPNKTLGLRAIEAFTGVVFKNFDFASLSDDAKVMAKRHVRIVSSLYGWLKPTDIIKPYRFDYTTRLAPDDTPLNSFWRPNVTECLVNELREQNATDVLNLLPADAEKCIDWKVVNQYAKVWKVDFKQHDGNAIRSPHAGKLKAMRGQLLRAIVSHNLCEPTAIASFESDMMMPTETSGEADTISFYV